MTKPVKYNLRCDECQNTDLVCPRCKKTVKVGTKFSKWLRNESSLDSKYGYANHNLDYVFYAFRDNWLITIEEKIENGNSTFSQRETHSVLTQMLKNGCQMPIQTSYGKKIIEYRGHYIIQFEKTNPEDSEWIKINDENYTKKELIFMLSFGKPIRFSDLQAEDLTDFVDKVNELGFNLGLSDLCPYFEEL